MVVGGKLMIQCVGGFSSPKSPCFLTSLYLKLTVQATFFSFTPCIEISSAGVSPHALSH